MNKTEKKKLLIVGKGAFGKLMAKYLRPYFFVSFISRSDTENTVKKRVKSADVIVFSVPMVGMETSIKRVKPYLGRETLLVDVMSVKVKPLKLLKKHFVQNEVLGAHPVFGPQSVKKNHNTLVGLPLVLCRETCGNRTYQSVKKFCRKQLKCRVIEQTAQQHDLEMAHVQGLAHFIGRALNEMGIHDYPTSTESYRQLVGLKELLAGDSWELFETIENTNAETKKVRKRLLKELLALEKKLA